MVQPLRVRSEGRGGVVDLRQPDTGRGEESSVF